VISPPVRSRPSFASFLLDLRHLSHGSGCDPSVIFSWSLLDRPSCSSPLFFSTHARFNFISRTCTCLTLSSSPFVVVVFLLLFRLIVPSRFGYAINLFLFSLPRRYDAFAEMLLFSLPLEVFRHPPILPSFSRAQLYFSCDLSLVDLFF